MVFETSPMNMFGKSLAAVSVLCGLTISSAAVAKRVDLGAGVSIEEPAELALVQDLLPGMKQAWATGDRQLSIEVVFIPSTPNEVSDAATEYNNWPGVAEALVATNGKSASKTIADGVGAPCQVSGLRIARDLDRMSIHVKITFTCATQPGPLVAKSELFRALTTQGTTMIRVTGVNAQGARVEAFGAKVWKSLLIDEGARVRAPIPKSQP
jgi:hypothetical protein